MNGTVTVLLMIWVELLMILAVLLQIKEAVSR